jgi:hypothetical protein
MSDNGGWIGVDLDGTLAHYDGWKGASHIGEPVPAMVQRVKRWLNEGWEVRIFTARMWPITTVARPGASVPVPEGDRGRQAFEALCAIHAWCQKTFGHALPVTCVKDYGMVELWDDRAVTIQANTGRMLAGSSRGLE